MPPVNPLPDWKDMQGLVQSSYVELPYAAYILMRIRPGRETAARRCVSASPAGSQGAFRIRGWFVATNPEWKRGGRAVSLVNPFNGARRNRAGVPECLRPYASPPIADTQPRLRAQRVISGDASA